MQAIYYQSSVNLIKMLRQKTLSCVELTRIFLDRIREVDPALNAVVDIRETLTLKQAAQADKAIANKESLGPLHGLPVTIKDYCLVKDYRCTSGTQGWRDYIADTDAVCVQRLKKAGAVVLGITNVCELFTAFETDNDLYGRTNNPYDLTKTPGGSSGGEASIIAAGGSPLGLGSDGGGSIRVPAHFTGIAGIKTTRGLLPRVGVHGIAQGLMWVDPVGVLGPMARYVEDLDLALSVLAGYCLRDPWSVPVEYGDMKAVDLRPLRIAFYTDDGGVRPQAAIEGAVKEAATFLSTMCFSVIEKVPAALHEAYDLLGCYFFGGDEGEYHRAQLERIGTHKVSYLHRQYMGKAKQEKKSSADWMKAFERIGKFKFDMQTYLEEVDIIICPPCATTAKTHGIPLKELRDFNYTMGYNITGWPAAVVRCGTDEQGLPVGVQIVGRPFQDHVVLAVAKRLEDHFGGWRSANENIMLSK